MVETEHPNGSAIAPPLVEPQSRWQGFFIAFAVAFGAAFVAAFLVSQMAELQDVPSDSMAGLAIVFAFFFAFITAWPIAYWIWSCWQTYEGRREPSIGAAVLSGLAVFVTVGFFQPGLGNGAAWIAALVSVGAFVAGSLLLAVPRND